jgi:hypothetical protein
VTQDSNATATSNQVNPTNTNIVVRNKSPGDDGPVTQTNNSGATAGAANSNAVKQGSDQAQTGDGNGSGGQSQAVDQTAPTTQTSNAPATSKQTSPTNGNVSVTIDPNAPDPNGSGLLGTLINIWVPHAASSTPTPATAPATVSTTTAAVDATPAAGATQVNTSTATAAATNTNQVTQTANQAQTAGDAGPTQSPIQVDGGQSQVVTQSAPTTQVDNASATSTQTGMTNLGGQQNNISSATATANNENQIHQIADQVQVGGAGGSQSQVIDQSAPSTQTATATATSHQSRATNGKHGRQTNTSTSTASAGGRNGASQTARQAQTGGGPQSQVIEQSAPSGADIDTRAAEKQPIATTSKPSWLEIVTAGAAPELAYFNSRIARWADPGAATRSASGPRRAARRDAPTPKQERLPLPPQSPTSLGAAPSGAGVGGLWVFATLLIPFALTAPWWARRYGPSGFRRLMGVVVRLERPG